MILEPGRAVAHDIHMRLRWIRESPARWDSGKQRIVGERPKGTFRYPWVSDARHEGEIIPGDWWRVEDQADGRLVGYGWMDITWGDAEVLLATDPAYCDKGVGSFILENWTTRGALNVL